MQKRRSHDGSHTEYEEPSESVSAKGNDSWQREPTNGSQKPELEGKTGMQAQQGTGENKPPVSREHTREIVAEAGTEQLPEEQYPDVHLDIPTIKVDEIKIEVDNLEAQVAISAELANLLKLNIGAHVPKVK